MSERGVLFGCVVVVGRVVAFHVHVVAVDILTTTLLREKKKKKKNDESAPLAAVYFPYVVVARY